jgi:hypothetical protein
VSRVRAFGAFCWDFVVGDDWVIAAVVVLALAATWLVSRTGVAAWWVLAAAVACVLPVSLWRARRR